MNRVRVKTNPIVNTLNTLTMTMRKTINNNTIRKGHLYV